MSEPDPIARFLVCFSASLADNSFVRLTLSRAAESAGAPERVIARVIELRGTAHLSLTVRYATRDETKNIPVTEAVEWLRREVPSRFRSALLATSQRDWQLFVPDKGTPRLKSHKPSHTEIPSRAHDRSRQTILDHTAQDWLVGLGVTDASGKVRPAMADKFRQINRYLEILLHLAKDCGWVTESERSIASGRSDNSLVIADMGCGKGYLTFGAWQLFQRILRLPNRIIGIEARSELVGTTDGLAKGIGAAHALQFVEGDIQSATLPPLDALIALHACDTATDDAIRRGIELGAKLILVAPCCHKQLRPQIGRPEPLAPLLRHGVMEERLAEWLTDGLRALYLEWAGYRTKIFEFVSSEHTPKNLMIAAVRESEPFRDVEARGRIARLKEFFGIHSYPLDWLLTLENAPVLVGNERSKG